MLADDFDEVALERLGRVDRRKVRDLTKAAAEGQ